MTAAGFHLAIAGDGHVEPGIWVAESDIGGEPFLIRGDLIGPEGMPRQAAGAVPASVLMGTRQRDVPSDWRLLLSTRAR